MISKIRIIHEKRFLQLLVEDVFQVQVCSTFIYYKTYILGPALNFRSMLLPWCDHFNSSNASSTQCVVRKVSNLYLHGRSTRLTNWHWANRTTIIVKGRWKERQRAKVIILRRVIGEDKGIGKDLILFLDSPPWLSICVFGERLI